MSSRWKSAHMTCLNSMNLIMLIIAVLLAELLTATSAYEANERTFGTYKTPLPPYRTKFIPHGASKEGHSGTALRSVDSAKGSVSLRSLSHPRVPNSYRSVTHKDGWQLSETQKAHRKGFESPLFDEYHKFDLKSFKPIAERLDEAVDDSMNPKSKSKSNSKINFRLDDFVESGTNADRIHDQINSQAIRRSPAAVRTRSVSEYPAARSYESAYSYEDGNNSGPRQLITAPESSRRHRQRYRVLYWPDDFMHTTSNRIIQTITPRPVIREQTISSFPKFTQTTRTTQWRAETSEGRYDDGDRRIQIPTRKPKSRKPAVTRHRSKPRVLYWPDDFMSTTVQIDSTIATSTSKPADYHETVTSDSSTVGKFTEGFSRPDDYLGNRYQASLLSTLRTEPQRTMTIKPFESGLKRPPILEDPQKGEDRERFKLRGGAFIVDEVDFDVTNSVTSDSEDPITDYDEFEASG